MPDVTVAATEIVDRKLWAYGLAVAYFAFLCGWWVGTWFGARDTKGRLLAAVGEL